MDQILQFTKLHPDAKITAKKYNEDAGYDLAALHDTEIPAGGSAVVGTGLAAAIPVGYYGQLFLRSGFALTSGIMINAGVIDASYRGEIKAILFNPTAAAVTIPAETRFAQMVIIKIYTSTLQIKESPLEPTSRGTAGFGSTGKY